MKTAANKTRNSWKNCVKNFVVVMKLHFQYRHSIRIKNFKKAFIVISNCPTSAHRDVISLLTNFK